ncbi:MAG: GNAT family N-acyltransferase [Myxococcota bacterium]
MNLEHAATGGTRAQSRRYPIEPQAIPEVALKSGPYTARFAKTRGDLEAAQRLRFEVFNLELGEGLQASYRTGRDEDQYDFNCHHLLVEHAPSGRVVGTYRLMSEQMAGDAGFYSHSEFHLETLPAWLLSEGVELGRACVAPDHRGGRVIYLLWKGIAQYLAWNDRRYLFGCCSIPATDPAVGVRAQIQLAEQGYMAEGFSTRATRLCSCLGANATETQVELPPLFKVYLDMGAKVCSEPAIDREFGVIDFLIVLDVEMLSDRTKQRMFGSKGAPGSIHRQAAGASASERATEVLASDYRH